MDMETENSASSGTDVNNPPKLIFKVKNMRDLELSSKPWEQVDLPVDALLLTVNDWEFLTCFEFLKNPFKSYYRGLGWVYFGAMSQDLKTKVGLVRCCEGAADPRGAINVVKNVVPVLKPRVVFCVGSCGSLNREKAEMGDVVISAKLTTYAHKEVMNDKEVSHGVCRAPCSRHVADLIQSAAEGWKPPLKNMEAMEITVHCDGELLSGPELVHSAARMEKLKVQYPKAIAIDMEGEGVYSAAYDLNMEWVVVKGVSNYADETGTEPWKCFASAMAASVVSHILKDSVVLRDWHHYKSISYCGKTQDTLKVGRQVSTVEDETRADSPPPQKRKVVTKQHKVKGGTPSDEELEHLAKDIVGCWEELGRRLGISKAELVAFHKENEEYRKKAYSMLLSWKQSNDSDATYEVLYEALCHSLVNRKDLGRIYCREITD